MFKYKSNFSTSFGFSWDIFKYLDASIGDSVNATKADIATEKESVNASSVNNFPTIPWTNISGINTAIKTTVVEIIAKETWLAPL